MAQHAPAELVTDRYPLMAEPLFGAEIEAHITSRQPADLGLLTITGASASTFEADTVGAALLLATPMSLVIVLDESITDAGDLDLLFTVAGVLDDDSAGTGTAQVRVPGYAQNQARTFPRGFAVDVVVPGGLKFKTFTAITVVCAAEATNARFRLFGLPDIADFERVGCTGAGSFQPRVRADAPVRCGSDPSAFVKEGDLREGSLRVEAKYFNYAQGLARYAGQRCTVLLKEMRSGAKIPATFHYVTQFVPSGEISMPEGSEACMNTTEGRFQTNLSFLAPTAVIAPEDTLDGEDGPLLSSFGYLTYAPIP